MKIFVLNLRDDPSCSHVRVDRATLLGNPFDWQVMGAKETLPHYLEFIRASYALNERNVHRCLMDPEVARAKTFVRVPVAKLRDEIMWLAKRVQDGQVNNIACWCTHSSVTGDEPDISSFKCHAEVLAWVILKIIKSGKVDADSAERGRQAEESRRANWLSKRTQEQAKNTERVVEGTSKGRGGNRRPNKKNDSNKTRATAKRRGVSKPKSKHK